MGKFRSLARRVLGIATGQPEPIELLAHDLADLVRRLPNDLDGQIEAELVEQVPSLLAQVDATEYLEQVPSFAKVAFHHIRQNDLQALHSAVNRGLLDLKQHSAALDEGRPVVHLPGWEDPEIARDNFVLSLSQTQLVTEVVRIRIIGDQVEAVIRAGFANIDADGAVPKLKVLTAGVTAKLVGETSGHRGGAATWRETFDRSTWSVVVPLAKLGPEQALELELEATLAGRVAAGRVALVSPPEPTGPAIDRITIERHVLLIEGRGLSSAPTLMSATTRVEAKDFTHLGTRFRVEFPTTADRWHQGELPLPIGDYQVVADGVPVPLAADLVNWPTDFVGESLVGHTTTDGLRLIKPRRRDENTKYGQRALREAYAQTVSTLQDAALFQCHWAEVATDSQTAIHRELHRRNPRMKLYWGVVDHSVAVPAGGTALVAGTREWYAALASAKYLVKNTEVGAYTVLRPGQVYLQTFHGQPFKQMGLVELARTMAPWRAEFEATERRSTFWDVICLPYPEAAKFYQDAYRWSGPAFDRGLPRTDSLLADDADRVRHVTREKLGIAPNQIAVLHATTAANPKQLDVAQLAESLGEEFVIVQRNHRSLARSRSRFDHGDGVVDVTDYPEINDLILASDIAILDHSSLRFDYAVTNKPMIFFLPDQEHHGRESSGFLFSFAQSAPGPLVEQADKLPSLLRDRSWVGEYESDYVAFNERFNKYHDGHAAERVVDGLLGWGR